MHRKHLLAILFATACLTILVGFVAYAGQGPSQACSDNVGTEAHILNSPATLNAEAGGPVGPQGWSWIVCASPTAWGDGSPAPTGGAVWFGSDQSLSGGNTWVGCGSDNNSTALAFGCNNSVSTNLSNPTSPSASVTYSNSASVPGVAGVQTGCTHGYTAGTGGIGCGTGGSPASRPSQWCDDGVGNAFPLVHDPVTVDAELDSSSSWACYSNIAYASSAPGTTGGAVAVWHPSPTGGGIGCYSDANATVRLDCSNGASLNTSNPTAPSANANSSNGITILGTPVNAPSVGAGTDCNSGVVAVSVSGCANGSLAGVSGQGSSSASGYNVMPGVVPGWVTPGIAISGTQCANGKWAAVSGTGCATSIGPGYAAVSGGSDASGGLVNISGAGNASGFGWANVAGIGNASNGFASISGLGSATSNAMAVSGTGDASGSLLAISGTGTAYGVGYNLAGYYLGASVSGTNTSTANNLAISGTGCASGNNSIGVYVSTYCASGGLLGIGVFGGSSGSQVALSGGGPTNGGLVAVSTGTASGGSVLNVSGGDRRISVLGVSVPYACDYGHTAGTGGVGCGGGGPASRPSQWCADGYAYGGREDRRVLHDPATLDFEEGSNYQQTCYSTGSYGGGGVQATGGALVANLNPLNPGLACASDPSAMVRIDCQASTSLVGDNIANSITGYSLGGSVSVLGMPVSAPGTQIQAGTGCASGIVAVSTSSCANGGVLGLGSTGSASGSGYSYGGAFVPGVAASGTGGSSAGMLAISGTGCSGGNDPSLGSSISATNCAWGGPVGISALGSSGGGILSVGGTGCSYGLYVLINVTGCTQAAVLGVSGTGNANSGQVAISGTGCAYAPVAVGPLCGAPIVADPLGVVAIGPTNSNNPSAAVAVANGGTADGSVLAANTTGQANSVLASASGTGTSTSYGYGVLGYSVAGVALSGTGCANGWYVGISGTGCANSVLASASGTGTSTSYGYGVLGYSVAGVALSGTGDAYGNFVALGGLGNASGGSMGATGTGDSSGGVVSISGIGDAYNGMLAVSGLGMASSNSGGLASVAIAGGKAVGRDLAISGMSDAEGTIAISGTGSSRGTVAVSPFDAAEGGLIGVSGKSGATGTIAVGGGTIEPQIKFRLEAGLIPDASYINALLANPPSNNSYADFGVVLTNAEYTEILRRETVASTAYTIRDDGLANAPFEYSGVYMDQFDGGKVKVGYTTNLSSHLSRIQGFFPYPNEVRMVQMQFSYRYLEAVHDSIWNSVGLLQDNGLILVGTAMSEKLNKILVGVAQMNSSQESFLLNTFGPAVLPFEASPPQPNQGRTSAWTPVRGGIEITAKNPNYRNIKSCTLGFISGDWAITAAHCAVGALPGGSDLVVDWWQPCIPNTKSADGKVICPSNPGRKTPISVSGQATRIRYVDKTDAAAFPLNSGLSSNYVYKNEKSYAVPVTSSQSYNRDTEDELSCVSGIATDYNCGRLKSRDARFSITYSVGNSKPRTYNFRHFRGSSGCTAPGNSGGPIIYGQQARGIIWGSWGQYSCPKGTGAVVYSHINHVLNALGLSL